MKYIKTEDPNLVRDMSSGAIINMDDGYYKQIVAQRAQNKQMQQQCEEMQSLKNELSDIKSMLQQVLNGRKDG